MTNVEFNEYFRKRTNEFAIKTLEVIEELPYMATTKIAGFQFGKSASSVGANFRAFCRGRSQAERFAKLCILVREVEECEYIFNTMTYGNKTAISPLLAEALEILKAAQKVKSSISPPK